MPSTIHIASGTVIALRDEPATVLALLAANSSRQALHLSDSTPQSPRILTVDASKVIAVEQTL